MSIIHLVMISLLNSSFSRQISRHLNEATKRAQTSLYRLSTGDRVNSSSDGIVDLGLVKSFDSQIRGMERAQLNISSTQGLVTMADTALSEMLTLAYGLRELAQKATDTSLTSTERDNLETEADLILQDFERIASQTEFNGMKLLDSTLGTQMAQVGARKDSYFTFSIGDARSISLGRLAIYSGAQGSISAALGSSNSVKLNGVWINASSSDGISSSKGSQSAMAIARAINAQAADTNVNAEIIATTRTFAFDNIVTTFTGNLASGDFSINGVEITGSSIVDTEDLISIINGFSSSTGVIASLDSNGDVKLVAGDGRNIQLVVSNSTTNNFYDSLDMSGGINASIFSSISTLSVGSNMAHIGAIRIWSSSEILIEGTSPSNALGISSGSKALVSGTAVKFMDLSDETNAEQAVKVLDATISQISSLQADVAAVHSRLEESSSYLLKDLNAHQDVRNQIGGTDYALETAKLAMAQILQDSNLAILTQANVSRISVARLLEGLK